jgi:Predicted AAA-ATPase/PD-(D/E)XK nuclease superfamily
MKIPYGESYFRTVIEDGYFYQDRTMYMERLERWSSRFLVFLRPRRFGKSLFVSALHHYYGLEYKEDFQKLFGNLYIGQHPTPLANAYMVLRFEFSRIDTATHESTYRGFLFNTISGGRLFMSAYGNFFTPQQQNIIEACKSPDEVIKNISDFVLLNNLPHKVYVLIDEYDHFANELLSFDMDRFKNDVSRNGFVRKFYEAIKTATGQGSIERIFITGVSPVTLDSLTSGFNITSNITINPLFHDLMGFTHSEVTAMLQQYGIAAEKVPEMMLDLTDWYDGYLFEEDAQERLFNPDMMLYFLQQYSINHQYPKVMLDTNVVSDYRKIRNIFKIGGVESQRYELLEQILREEEIKFSLTLLYNLEANFTEDDFLSLLFYMGMLSCKGRGAMGTRYRIPNYVIKKLYFEYFAAVQLEPTRFATTTRPIAQTIETLLTEGDAAPFLKVVEYVLLEHHSNRDDIVYGEKHLQTLMIGLLSPYQVYYIHSEYETGRGYVDIFLERMPDTLLAFDVLLELKYIKKKESATAKQVADEAKVQMQSYLRTERFARPDVRGFYVVFTGPELTCWEEVTRE